MKKIATNVMTGILSVAMMASMAVPTFAAELTSAEIAGADTVNGTYNVYEGTDADLDGDIDAGAASSVVVIDAEATTFKVTVPIALHVAQDANGDKTYADDMADGTTGAAKIINECALGQVKIADVKVVAADGYAITAMDADYANMKVNSKVFGFQINGLNVNTDGTLEGFAVAEDTITSTVIDAPSADNDLARVYADYNFVRSGSSAFPVIANKSVLPITYRAMLPAFSAAVTNANVGGVVFTIDFN